MPLYEYKVIPAPKRPLRVGGPLSRQPKFADGLAAMMNDLGADGWEYVRTEAMSYRQGRLAPLRKTDVMIFRRETEALAGPDADAVPPLAWVAPRRAEAAPVARIRPAALA